MKPKSKERNDITSAVFSPVPSHFPVRTQYFAEVVSNVDFVKFLFYDSGPRLCRQKKTISEILFSSFFVRIERERGVKRKRIGRGHGSDKRAVLGFSLRIRMSKM